MANCLIGLGSNLGDRGANLQAAIAALSRISQATLLAQSSFRETKPAGGPQSQAAYLNAAATVETSLSPLQMLAELQRIENELGRVRTEHWGPRAIDLDLLLYDRVEMESPELTLPHPRMSFRRFVLEPAAEIAAEMVYPINGWTIRRLVDHSLTSPRIVVLLPSHSKWCMQAPATRLLKALDSEQYVQQQFRRDLENETPSKKKLARWRAQPKNQFHRLGPMPLGLRRPEARWRVTDSWSLQDDVEAYHDDPILDSIISVQILRDSVPRLVVVWQPDEVPVMTLLARIRRNPECPPVLWIPKVTLEQAHAEVIAAMAAME